MKLIDTYHRVATYLRIGVTDRCNLRCRYCMPEQGIDFAQRKDLLSYEEILRLADIFRILGVRKVRLTGGEPFVRKDFGILLKKLSDLFPQVHITTNATLLGEHIQLLQDIKIAGLNISIDSLDRDKFFLITRRDAFPTVMTNILSCIDKKIPIKLNMVVMQGVNDSEIIDFIAFGRKHNIEVRFIEAMPFNEDDGNRNVFMSAKAMEEHISRFYPSLQKIKQDQPSASELYKLDDEYQFGIIPAYSRSLCGSCNRIRLTPQGELMTCLYATQGKDMRAMLRDTSVTKPQLQQAIMDAVYLKKKDGFAEERLQENEVFRSMTTIGG